MVNPQAPAAGQTAALPPTVPTAEEVRAALSSLSRQELIQLADRSTVNFNTLLKVANGQTEDPRLNTVSMLVPHLRAMLAEKSASSAATAESHA